MDAEATLEKLRSEVLAVDGAALLPHHRRGALLILRPHVDLLAAAVAIASDDSRKVQALTDSGALYKPTLGQIADWIANTDQRFQFVVLQPFVLAQPLFGSSGSSKTTDTGRS